MVTRRVLCGFLLCSRASGRGRGDWLRLRRRWRSHLGLLNLKIVNHGPHAIDCPRIVGSSGTLHVALDVTAEGNHAACGLYADLAALDSRISIYLILYVAGNLS